MNDFYNIHKLIIIITFVIVLFGIFSIILIARFNIKLKQSLEKKNKKLNKILTLFNENIISSKIDLKGNIIYVNKALSNISGYSIEELLGQSYSILLHLDMPEHIFKDLWKTIQSGKVWNGETKNKIKDGEYYWLDETIIPEFGEEGNIVVYNIIGQDITAQKKVEELSQSLEQKIQDRTMELKESQEQFSSMISNVPGAIYRVINDSIWSVIYVSNEIENITGYKASDFIENKELVFPNIMHPNDVKPIKQMIQEQFTKRKNFEVDYRIISKSGEIVWIRSRGHCIRTDDGDSFIDGILINITDLKKLELKNKMNQEQMAFASKYANLGYWTFNPQIENLLVNDTFVEMIGYKENELLLNNYEKEMFKPFKNGLKSWEKLLHPDDVSQTREAIRAHIDGEVDLLKVEYRMKKADGQWMWFLAVGRIAEKDKNGKAIKFNGVTIDIQDAKDTQEIISKNKLFLDALLDSQEQIVITTDGKTLINANKKFLDFFKIKNINEFKKYYNCICDKFTIDKTDYYLQKNMGKLTWIEYVIDNKDKTHKVAIVQNNSERIFSVTAAYMPIDNGNIKSAVFTDITELEFQKKQTELILSTMLSPIFITSKNTSKIVYANSFAEIQYETTLDTLVGLSTEVLYSPQNQREKVVGILEREGILQNCETKFKTLKGKEFDGILSLADITFEGQSCYLAVISDISEQKSREILINKLLNHTKESIEYASLIQDAIIPSNDLFKKYFSDYFIIWEPKDIVGGDIYLFDELRNENECLIMVIDCTGHGVPGAFVSMLVKAMESHIKLNLINSEEEVSPSKILCKFNKRMKHILKQEDQKSISNVGFDGGIIYYNKKEKLIKFSGAETPLFYIEDDILKTIKGSRQSIGYKKSDIDFEFEEHTIEVKEGMQFYISTDGYFDQNGGEKGFPFGKRKFSEILENNNKLQFKDQQELLLSEIQKYQGSEDRNDDITIIGIKI